MEKVYLHYPYMEHLNTKIKQKFTKNQETHVVFYHTIFAPNTESLLPDKGNINGIPILRAYEKNGEVVHVLSQDIPEERISMDMDIKHRQESMKTHAAYLILKSLAETIYGVKTSTLHYREEGNYFDLSPANYLPQDFSKNLEKLSAEIIQNALPIRKVKKNNENMLEIPGMQKIFYDGLSLENTGEIFSIRIKNVKKMENLLRVYFIAGEPCYKEYQKLYESILPLSEELHLTVEDTLKQLFQYKNEKDALEEKLSMYEKKILDKDLALLNKECRYLRGVSILCYIFEEDTDLHALGEKISADIILLGSIQGDVYLRVINKRYNLSPLIQFYTKKYALKVKKETSLSYEGSVGGKVEDFFQVLIDEITKQIR